MMHKKFHPYIHDNNCFIIPFMISVILPGNSVLIYFSTQVRYLEWSRSCDLLKILSEKKIQIPLFMIT